MCGLVEQVARPVSELDCDTRARPGCRLPRRQRRKRAPKHQRRCGQHQRRNDHRLHRRAYVAGVSARAARRLAAHGRYSKACGEDRPPHPRPAKTGGGVTRLHAGVIHPRENLLGNPVLRPQHSDRVAGLSLEYQNAAASRLGDRHKVDHRCQVIGRKLSRP